MSNIQAPPAPTTMKDLLRCPICLKLFESPVLATCGHTFCNTCALNCINTTGLCPFDSKPISEKTIFPNRIIAAEVEQYSQETTNPAAPSKCIYAEYGCEWTGPKEAIPTHLSHCDFEKMKHFVVQKEQETERLRSEVARRDAQISQLQKLLSEGGHLQTELSNLLRVTYAYILEGKSKIAHGLAVVKGQIGQAWTSATDEQNYKQLVLKLEETATKCSNSMKNIINNIQVASKHATDSEFVTKMLVQTSAWKNDVSKRLVELKGAMEAAFAANQPNQTSEDRNVRAAMQASVSTYLNEIQAINEKHETEQQQIIASVVETQPIAIPNTIPVVVANNNANTNAQVDNAELQMEDFTPLENHPMPSIHTTQLNSKP